MFSLSIPQDKQPINLSLFENFEAKFLAVCDYAKIRNIYFEVSNPQDVNVPRPDPVPLKVIQMEVPLGSSSYLNLTLKKCHAILAEEVNKYTHGDDDFDSISQALERCIEKSIQNSEGNNIWDPFTFDQDLLIHICKGEKWEKVLFSELEFPPVIYEDLREHFKLRQLSVDNQLIFN